MLQKMNMILIDNQLLDSLTEQAKASPRLRMNLDIRNGSSDTSQTRRSSMTASQD